MSKTAIAGVLSDELGLSKADALKAVDLVLEGIQRVVVSTRRVTFVGFGSFALQERREPARGESSEIQTRIRFTPGERFESTVAKHYPPQRIQSSAHARKRR
jgi:nucleoid DNA-binding protein